METPINVMYGLRVIRHGEPDHIVWVSAFPSKVTEHMKFIQDVVDEGKGATLFEQVTSQLIVDHPGWYKLKEDLHVKIISLNDRECMGLIYKLRNGKRDKDASARSTWYVNGVSNNQTCNFPILGKLV